MISVNNLKTDSKDDYEKVMTSIPSPEPAISCFDDLDFFKDFENEFPAIVYNDAQTSKSDLLTELILSPQHIDEFNLNDKTSLSEYDEEEQNILYFNDLFPFNIIHPGDLKTEKDNDDNEIDIIQSSGILFYLFMNLYVSLGVSFNPKRYYKDGVYTRMLRRPRSRATRYGYFMIYQEGGCSRCRDCSRDLKIDIRYVMVSRVLRLALKYGEELPIIDMAELVRLKICIEIDNTWAWVAMGPERKPDATTGAPGVAQDAPARMDRLEKDVHEIRGVLAEQREVIDAMARDLLRFTVCAASRIAQLLDSARVTYTPYSETRIPYQRGVRCRTDGANTSTAH
ncbi:hypothetical protein Tco_1181172 [Tanacetum coccineum]